MAREIFDATTTGHLLKPAQKTIVRAVKAKSGTNAAITKAQELTGE